MPKHLLSTTAGSDQTNPALLRQHPPHFISASSFLFFYLPPSLISAIEYAGGTSDISLICRQPDIYAVLKLIWHHCFGCWVKVAGGIKGSCARQRRMEEFLRCHQVKEKKKKNVFIRAAAERRRNAPGPSDRQQLPLGIF